MIDLSRAAITVALGHWKVSDMATFEAGAPMTLNSNGEMEVCVHGDNFFGIAKWNKTTSLRAAVHEEPIITGATAGEAVPLANANIVTGSVRVVLAADGSHVSATNYEINHVNGTIVGTGVNAIPPSTAILVSYRYTLTTEEMIVRGANYQNTHDDTMGSGRITVIQDYAIVYTDQYDTATAYSEGSSVFVTAAGVFGSTGVGGAVGRIVETPSAANALLGIQIG